MCFADRRREPRCPACRPAAPREQAAAARSSARAPHDLPAQAVRSLPCRCVCSAKIAVRISLIVVVQRHQPTLLTRSSTCGRDLRHDALELHPVAYSRWMTRSCRSRAIRSRSSKTARRSASLRCSASSSAIPPARRTCHQLRRGPRQRQRPGLTADGQHTADVAGPRPAGTRSPAPGSAVRPGGLRDPLVVAEIVDRTGAPGGQHLPGKRRPGGSSRPRACCRADPPRRA